MNLRPVIAILGVGSVRSGPPILASLAHFREEEGVEVRLYDGDDERLDLMDRLARTLFGAADASHRVTASSDLAEALCLPLDAVILCAGANCAQQALEPRVRPRAIGSSYPRFPETSPERRVHGRTWLIQRWLAQVAEKAPPSTPMLSTMRVQRVPEALGASRLRWPAQLSQAERLQRPHEIMRWIRCDDSVMPMLDAHRSSPVVQWLDSLELPRPF